MTLRTGRMVRVLFVAVAIYSAVLGLRWLRQRLDYSYGTSATVPNVSIDDIPDISPVLGTGHWEPISQKVEVLRWSNRYESIPDRVSLIKWRDNNRTYYQIIGPVDPKYLFRKFESPTCEVFFPPSCDTKKWEFWMDHGNVSFIAYTGSYRQSVATKCYNYEINEGYVTLSFWVPKIQFVGNIVFNYEKSDYSAWVATEEAGTKKHDNMLRWSLP